MKKIISLALVSAFILGVTGCTKQGDDVTQTTKKLVIGTEAKYAPYEFKILKDGKEEFAGFDIDLGYEIGKDLGVEVEYRDLPFDSLMLELQSGNIDLAIAALSPKPERAEAADFSKSYYDGEQAIVIKKSDADKFVDETSFSGLQVAAQNGSIQADYVNNKMTGSKIVTYAAVPEIVYELKTGNVSAAVVEKPVIEALLADNDDLMILKTYVDEDSAGNVVCVPKGNTELLESVNKTIDRVLADGTMDQYILKAYNDMDLAIEE